MNTLPTTELTMPWLHVFNNNQDRERVCSTQIHLPRSAYHLIHTVMYLSEASQWLYVFFHQVELITMQAMKAGFTGGLVVDYPNSTRAKKWVAINTVWQATHVLHSYSKLWENSFIHFTWPTKAYIQQGFVINFSHVVEQATIELLSGRGGLGD